RFRLRSVARVRSTLASRQTFDGQSEIDEVMHSEFVEVDTSRARHDDATDRHIRAGHPLDLLRERGDHAISEGAHCPEFTLSTLAAALHVSVRQVQRAYARGGRSVQEAIRDHRVGVSAMLTLGVE
ncbi:hypothetical protein AAIH18_22485, partial [Pantoea agglomerans]